MIQKTINFLKTGSLGRTVPTAALFLTGILLLPSARLNALFSGAPAQVALGQPALNLGAPNTVTGAGFGLPRNLAIGNGRVYVADTANNRVLWWALNTTGAAAGVLGQADLSGSLPNRGGAAGPATLSAPAAVALDSANNVWVADTGNNRVLRFPAAVASGGAADLALGQVSLYATSFNTSAAALNGPQGVATDGSNVWVADTGNNRLLKYNTPVLTGTAATLVLGQANFNTSGAATSIAGLRAPAAVAVDGSANVWAADTGNNRVVKYSAPGTSGAPLALELGQANVTSGNPNRGAAAAQNSMNSPQGVAVGGTSVWVADTNNSRVLKFNNPSVSGQNADLELGQADFASASPNRGAVPAADNSLNLPSGVAVTGTDVWVTDGGNFRALRFQNPLVSGVAAANLVLGQADFLQYAANTLQAGSLFSPNGAAVDSATGRVYAADYNNNRVLFWNSVPAFTSGQPADGVIGQPDFVSMLPNRGGPASDATLSAPYAVAVDGANSLWVNDMGNYRILHYTAPGLTGATADIVLGQANFTTTAPGALGAATLNGASGMAFGAGGLWVADSGNHRVLRFGTLTNGAAADFVLGQADFISNQDNRNAGNPPTANTLKFPTGVWADGGNNVWVADSDNNRVLKFAPPFATPFAGPGPGAVLELGQSPASFVTAVSGASQSALNNPGSVMVDAASYIWVADSFNSRVLRFPPAVASGGNADTVLGQADFTASAANRGGLTAANTLSYPNAAFTAGTSLWIGDTSNNRLLQETLDPTTPLAPVFNAVSSSTLGAVWTAVPSAAGYTAIFSSNSNFVPLLSSGPLTAAATAFAGLGPDTSYYLEVKISSEPDSTYAINLAVGYTSPSVTPLAPATVTSSGSVTASWSALAGASYYVRFSAAADFSTIISSGVQLPASANFAGLNPDTNYYLSVRLSTEAAAALAANTVTARTGPVIATALSPSASGLSSAGFTMNWANTGATYIAVLADDSGFTSIRSSAPVVGNSATYSGLSEYTTYYFEVKVSTEGDAAYGVNSLAVRTAAVYAPLTPRLTSASSNALAFAWNSVSGAQYTVVFSTAADFSAYSYSLTQNSNSASFTGLSSDTTYYLEVKLSSNPAAAFGINTLTVKTMPLGTRLGILANANSSSMISLSWPYSPDPSYVAVLATDPLYTNIVSSFTTSPGEYNENYTGLTGLTSYYYQMKLSTETDAGYAFNRLTLFTPATQLFPNADAVTTGGFTISWSTVAGKNYAVLLSTDSAFTTPLSSTTQSTASKTFTGLNGGMPYYFAVKITGEGDAAYADLANQGAQTTLALPLAPSLTALSASSLSASWTAVPGASYVAVLADDPLYMSVVSSGTTATNSAAYTGLAPYTTYYFQMKLTTQDDATYASNRAARRTLPLGTSLAPALVSMSSMTIKASWTAVAGSTYVAVLAADPDFVSILSSATLTLSSAVYTGLNGDQPYYFEVKLSTESELAYLLNFAVGGTLPTPLSPNLVPAGPGTLNVNWAAVPGAYYTAELAMDPGFARVVSTVTTESTLTSFTRLIGNLPYYMRVKLAGEGPSSFAANTVSATPPAGSLRVNSVTPNTAIYLGGPTEITINGAGITYGPTITLIRAGQPDVVADSVVWMSPSQVKAVVRQPFIPGRWTVLVTGNTEATALVDSFVVLTADPGSAKIYQGIFKPLQGQAAQLTTALTLPGKVSVRIYDTMGRRVREMFDGSRAAGNYLDIWDGRNDDGSMCASGVYLVRFETPEFKTTKRVVLLK
jgi:hypothetical protein